MADVKLQITREDDTTYDIDNTTGLKSVESLSQITTNPNEISYGFITNNGAAEILDEHGYIRNSINNGEMDINGLNCSLFANGKRIQKFPIVDSKYNVQTKTLSLSFGSMYDDIRNIQIPFDKDNSISGESKSLLQILEDCFQISGFYTNHSDFMEMFTENIYISQFEDMPAHFETIATYLSNIKFIPGSYYRSEDTFFNIVDNICKAAQLNVMTMSNGKIKFVSARPTIDFSKNIIKVLPKNQLQSLQENIIVKNKYNNIIYRNNIDNINETIVNSSRWNIPYDNSYDVSAIPNANIVTRSGYTWVEYFITIQSSANYVKLLKVRSGSYSKSGDLADVVRENGNISTDILSNPSLDSADAATTIDTFSWDNYNINKIAVILPYYSTRTSDVIAVRSFLDGNYFGEIGLSVWGRISETITEEKQYTIGDNILQYTYDNQFTHDSIIYEYNNKQYALIKMCLNNILIDYKNGLRNAQITLNCLDYYDLNGNLTKNWANGEIIENTDAVRIDKDYDNNSVSNYMNGQPRYWKITSAKFFKTGVPVIDVEMQEINISNIILDMQVNISGVSLVTTRVSSPNPNATIGIISNDDIIYRGDVLTFTITPNVGKEINRLTINGQNYENGTQFNTSSIDSSVSTLSLYCDTGVWTNFPEVLYTPIQVYTAQDGVVYTGEIQITGLIANSKIRVSGYLSGQSAPDSSFSGIFGVPETNNITISRQGTHYETYFKLMYAEDGKLIYEHYFKTTEGIVSGEFYEWSEIEFSEFSQLQ